MEGLRNACERGRNVAIKNSNPIGVGAALASVVGAVALSIIPNLSRATKIAGWTGVGVAGLGATTMLTVDLYGSYRISQAVRNQQK